MTSDTNHANNGSRRNFLKMASTGAISAAALAAFPPSIRRALAIPANNATGTMRDVEHVVILMQENRSFDNYFGTLQGVRGFGDRFPIPLAGGLNVWQQTYVPSSGPSRTVLPYYLDSSAGNAQRVSGTPHSYPDAQNAWDLGRMSKWPTYKQTQSMGYYKQAELDFQFALANAFTLCDAYHCSFHGGTNTNRLFHWTGTNDPTGAAGGPVIDNSGDHLDAGVTYSWKTTRNACRLPVSRGRSTRTCRTTSPTTRSRGSRPTAMPTPRAATWPTAARSRRTRRPTKPSAR